MRFYPKIIPENNFHLFQEFPSKVKKLDEQAGSDKWSLSRLSEIHSESKKSTGDRVVTGVKRKRMEHGDGKFFLSLKL